MVRHLPLDHRAGDDLLPHVAALLGADRVLEARLHRDGVVIDVGAIDRHAGLDAHHVEGGFVTSMCAGGGERIEHRLRVGAVELEARHAEGAIGDHRHVTVDEAVGRRWLGVAGRRHHRSSLGPQHGDDLAAHVLDRAVVHDDEHVEDLQHPVGAELPQVDQERVVRRPDPQLTFDAPAVVGLDRKQAFTIGQRGHIVGDHAIEEAHPVRT